MKIKNQSKPYFSFRWHWLLYSPLKLEKSWFPRIEKHKVHWKIIVFNEN